MRRFIFLVLVFVLLAFAWFRWEKGGGLHRASEKYTPAAGPVIDLKDVQVMAALDGEYTKLVQSVVPSVVSIATARRVRVPLVDPFDFLFGRQRVAERTETALGSGVVVSKEGHILTNHHVIANMEQIQVQFTDGRVLPARLIGSDEAVDIAVLRVEASNLTPLPLGDSDQVRVGQMVFAVGNPFGLQETVTRGIISAKGRALHDSGVEFLQTDAAVNPGNSGGPLLNLRGEIIGINSSIYSQTGGWAGISFAIPANTARSTMEALLKNGRPIRGYLGVNMMSLTPALAQRFGLQDTRGALITTVQPGSPAERAGLQPGDIVRSFNGRDTEDGINLRNQIAAAGVGAKVQLGILRNGQLQKVSVQIVELPSSAPILPQTTPMPLPPGPSQTPPSGQISPSLNNVLAGIGVSEIPPNLRNALPANIQGVVVNQLQPDSPASERLRIGDIIEEVDNHPVRTPADFAAIAKAVEQGERSVLYIARGGVRSFVVLTP